MAADPNLAEVVKQLDAIRSEIAAQGSTSSMVWLHFWDLIVIAVADIIAAGVVLITFESWRETEKQSVERAQRVLAKLGPHMEPLITFCNKAIGGGATAFGTPWGSNSSVLHADFWDPILLPGSIEWTYPGGKELSTAFENLKAAMRSAGGTVGGGPQSQATKILSLAEIVEGLRKHQFEVYLRGKRPSPWKRFLKWLYSLWRTKAVP